MVGAPGKTAIHEEFTFHSLETYILFLSRSLVSASPFYLTVTSLHEDRPLENPFQQSTTLGQAFYSPRS